MRNPRCFTMSRFAYEEHNDFYWSPRPNIYSNHHAGSSLPPAFSSQPTVGHTLSPTILLHRRLNELRGIRAHEAFSPLSAVS